MTDVYLEPIASGTPYRVTHTDGQPPLAVTEFLGTHAFLIHQNRQHALVTGVGSLDAVGTGVRFYQKDPTHEGRDVRVWHLRALPDNMCVAEHQAAI